MPLSSGSWRGRVLLVGLLLVFYLIAAVFISGLSDIQPGLSNRVFRGGPGGFIIAHDNTVRLGSRLYRVGNAGGVVPVLPANRRLRLQWCSTLKFEEPPSKTITALVSFPGSGNTWLRYLIQQSTGIYTGSIYIDFGLLKNGFPAENVIDGSVVVVKTHESGHTGREPFAKAILLLRSPAAAIQAEFNRQSGGHVGFASPERYKRHKGQHWLQFVRTNIKTWRTTYVDWLTNFTGPIHVIFYKKLVDNVEGSLRGLINFLGRPLDKQLLQCAVERKEGIYRRHKRLLNFDPFTKKMRAFIQNEENHVFNVIYSFRSRITTNDENFFTKFRRIQQLQKTHTQQKPQIQNNATTVTIIMNNGN